MFVSADVLSRWNMADPGPHGLDDEAFPGFLAQSLDGSGGRPTLGNVSLGSGPGLPVAASTVAKVRAGCGNRCEEDRCGGLHVCLCVCVLVLNADMSEVLNT